MPTHRRRALSGPQKGRRAQRKYAVCHPFDGVPGVGWSAIGSARGCSRRPTAGQSMLEDQILVGHCVNFLPIGGSWNVQTRLSDQMASVAKRVLDAYEHQSYTLGTLVRKLALPRGQNRVPLAEIQFNLERLAERIQLPQLDLGVEPNAKAHVNFDLFLNVIESADGLRLDCDYNTDLFDADTIDRWLVYYQGMLQAIVTDASQTISRAMYLPAAEREQLQHALNKTTADYPMDRCVHELLEARAAVSPDAVAAQYGTETLSYQELNARANQLANTLLKQVGKTGKGHFVGVAIDRSLNMLAALYAVMKAGYAYIPLDPTHPRARLAHILAEAGVVALITDGSVEGNLVPTSTPVIDCRASAAAIGLASTANPAVPRAADDSAYLIYTSGSTGLPKGVEVSHRSVINLLCSMSREPGLQDRDVLMAVTTVAFDIAGLSCFYRCSPVRA